MSARATPPRLIDDAFLDDPYPPYAALREAGRIHWSEEFFGGAWLLSRHEDVELLLRDPRFSAQRTGGWLMDTGDGAREELSDFQRLFARAMLFRDAPDHPRLRRVLHEAFKPEALRPLRSKVESWVHELLADVEPGEDFDFIERLARPLPARVIATLMGVDVCDQAHFTSWSDDLADFIGAPRPTLAQARRAQASLLAMGRYLDGRLRAGTDEGLLGRLLQAARAGEIDPGPELLAQCAMLLLAGHETTRHLLGTGLYHLLSRPALWASMRSEPHRLPGAIRELLRYDSPVQYTGRRVAVPLVLHGQPLQRGDLVIGLIGAANRDPRRHERPDDLDISRSGGASLAFGCGPHVCIGAALTLIEAETVFAQLLRHRPGLALAGKPRWGRNPLYRGLVRLMVRVDGP